MITSTTLSCADILSGKAAAEAVTTIKGWVKTRRDSKAGISFVSVSDGSCFHPVQVVVPNTLGNYHDEVIKLTAGCAVEATGLIVPSPAKGQPFEMQATDIKVIGWVDDPDTYPITPKAHTMEFLREVAHLRPRTNVIGAATRVRHTVAQAIHRFFHEHGYLWVNTPIITASDAEGAGELFRVSTLDLANLPLKRARIKARLISAKIFLDVKLFSRYQASSMSRPTAWRFPRSIPLGPPFARRIPIRRVTWLNSG